MARINARHKENNHGYAQTDVLTMVHAEYEYT